VVAGIGNIYADESLFAAGIHPKRKIEGLTSAQIERLAGHIKRILGQSIEYGGTSFRDYVDTNGRRGGFKGWLHVYGKKGSACPQCQTPIRKIVVASRGTHFCPRCQRPPRS
jgi:formamidopyrimidine-DNA glycosylase